MVEPIAHFLAQSKLPEDELAAAGNLALVEAAGSWNPLHGTCGFRGYAYNRIRGAMFDAVRKWTHYSRHHRAAPDSALGLELVEEVAPARLAVPDHLEWVFLADALRRIPRRDAHLVLRYLFAGYAMDEDAAREGVTPSRISQRLRVAREALAAELQPTSLKDRNPCF